MANQSIYAPDNIETHYHTTLPDWFYEKLGMKVAIIESPKLYSYYESPPPTIAFTRTWQGVERTPSVCRSTIVHELAHAYHYATKTITDETVTKRIKEFYKQAKETIKTLTEEQKDMLTYKNFPAHQELFRQNYSDLELIEIKRYLAVAGDIFASLSKGKWGFGHPEDYWNDAIRKYQEFFANSADIYFNGNPIIQDYFEELSTIINLFWNNEQHS